MCDFLEDINSPCSGRAQCVLQGERDSVEVFWHSSLDMLLLTLSLSSPTHTLVWLISSAFTANAFRGTKWHRSWPHAANGGAHAAHTCEDAALTGNGFVWGRFLPNQVPDVLIDRDGFKKKKKKDIGFDLQKTSEKTTMTSSKWKTQRQTHCVPDHADVLIFLADTWSDGVVLLKTPRSGHNTTHKHIPERIFFFSYNFITFQHWKIEHFSNKGSRFWVDVHFKKDSQTVHIFTIVL